MKLVEVFGALAEESPLSAASLWGAVITTALTLSGGVALFYVKAWRDGRDTRRAFRRSMHNEAVDTLADVDLMMGHVRNLVVFREPSPWTDMDNFLRSWYSGPGRQLKRLEHGHPDVKVRVAALELQGHLAYVLAAGEGMLDLIRKHDPGQVPPPSERHIDQMYYTFNGANDAFRKLRNAVLGEDAAENEPESSTRSQEWWSQFGAGDEQRDRPG